MSNSGFEINKITGAVLLAGVIAMVTGMTSDALYGGGAGHGDHKEKRGYRIEVADSSAPGDQVAEKKGPVDITPFIATADAAAGKSMLKKCTACHTFNKDGKHGVGPNQFGLFSRAIASSSGYNYSKALLALGGKKWTEQTLSEFLAKPKKYAPGNKMAFAGIKKPQDRANLIAYLKTLK